MNCILRISPRGLLGLALPLLLLACAVWWWLAGQEGRPADTETPAFHAAASRAEPKHAGPAVSVENATDAATHTEFRKWLATRDQRKAAGGPEPHTAAITTEGMNLAEARSKRMARLIRENPQQALAEALSYSEWESLTPEIQALVEKPFTMVADYGFYPVCGNGRFLPPGTPTHIAELSLPDGSSLEAFAFGSRMGHMSKRRLPVQGIALDGLAALREETLQPVQGADLVTLIRRLPDGMDMIGSGPVHAVAGGRIFAFESPGALDAANDRLALADARPGPVAASSRLLPDGEGEIDWDQLETFADQQASAWTETRKKVFLIRVNFTDALAEPVTQTAAATVLNGVVSDSIRAMSYNKTWVEATVSTRLYTMPQTAAYYVNGGSSFNSELLRDARNTFRNNKSGADSPINIGPVSNNSNGDGGGLGDYDIVGITFGNLGMYSGGIRYAGLAGGGNLWMQNTNSSGVYIHEFGHNYGIGHASSWDVVSNNPVDPAGASAEYGDIFDIMGDGPDPEGHFHSQAKQKLDWLSAAQWQDATTLGSNTYRIHRIDDANTAAANHRGVRITKVASPAEYYWLSYRPAFVNNLTQSRGACLNWQRSGQTRCWLVDTTPGGTDGKNDSSITLGRTYSDTAANVHLTPLATGGTGADQWVDVRVNLGPFPGNAAPAANPIAGPATVPARSSVTFTGSATDANSDTLAWHWNTKDGLVKDNHPAVSHTWVVGGAYALDLTVSDMKGGTDVESKTVTVTDPLDTWTQQASGGTGYLRASTRGKGRFVVADLWGGVLTSWDGVTWTNNGDLPDFDRDPRLAYGNNVFVVVGKRNGVAASQICYSSDARTWNVAAFPAGVPQMRDVIFANGRFLAAGDGGNILTSTDGITWSLTTVSGAPDFRRLAWDGSVWLAMAYHTGNSRTETAWTSANGTAWTQHADLGFSVYSVLGRAGVLHATGWYGGVTYSTDHGLTWKAAQTPGSTRWSTNQIAVADDGTMLTCAMAMDESGTPQAFLVSTDGTQWFRSQAGTGFAYEIESLVCGSGRVLATSDGGEIRTSGSFYPNNTAPSASFALAPATAPVRESRLFAGSATDAEGDTLTYTWDFGLPGLITDGSSVVKSFDFGGSYIGTFRVSDEKGGITTLTRNVTVTDPARTWTQRASGTTNALRGIAANATTAVAVGAGATIRSSTDGLTWTTRTVPGGPANINFDAAAWDGTRFLIAGHDYRWESINGWVGVIYSSQDGISWTRCHFGSTTNTQLYGLACNGSGVAVAVGNSGTILESINGTTWNPVTVAALASTTLKGASFGGGTWLISGHYGGSGAGKVFTSTNRINWMDQTAGAGIDASWQDIRKTAWLNNRFVGSGWFSRVRVSTDLGTTFTSTRTDREETPGLAYGDNIYFAAGINRDASNADIDLLSLDGSTWTRSAAPTTDDRNGATFFKHTFITVGVNGSIWQSADVTPGGGTPNTPPGFSGYATSTPYQTGVAIPLATLLAAASDIDGDVVLVTSSGSSAHGGTTVLQASSILYTPPAGYTGADIFPITLTDARGASTPGTVNVTITPTNDPTLATPPAITLLPGNAGVKIDFTGLPDTAYQVQRSIDLSAWTTLATITASPAGAVSHTDPSPPAGKAFYRIRKP